MWFLNELRHRNEVLFYFGLACLACALVCLVLAKVYPLPVLGTNAWYKPIKFFTSTTIFVWSMAWYLHYLPAQPHMVAYAWGMVVLFTFELVYISIQAARGVASHFNVDSGLHASLWGSMAVAAVGISVWTLVIGFSFFTHAFPQLPAAYVWGIRFGLVVFFFFSLEGLAMGARLAHTVGAPDGGPGLPFVNWSRLHGDLRIAHFLGMHALQILPLLGFFVFRSVYAISVCSLVYLAVCVLSLVQALAGKPLWR
jgi:hypothetical protein